MYHFYSSCAQNFSAALGRG